MSVHQNRNVLLNLKKRDAIINKSLCKFSNAEPYFKIRGTRNITSRTTICSGDSCNIRLYDLDLKETIFDLGMGIHEEIVDLYNINIDEPIEFNARIYLNCT